MKRLLFIWFIAVSIAWRPAINIELDFFEKTELDGIVYAIPGAVGDGVTDDTAALQAWADGGCVGTGTPGAVYLISSTIVFSSNASIEIADFNGSTITSNNSTLNNLILVDKPQLGDHFHLRNVNLDGNSIVDEGIIVESLMSAKNVSIQNFYSDTDNGVGIRIDQENDATQVGHYIFEDVDIDNIESLKNGQIGTSLGSARAVLIDKDYVPSGSRYTFIGGTWGNIWGDDGDVVQLNNTDQTNTDNTLTEFIGITFGYMNRRHTKVTSGWAHFVNCIFNVTPSGHPKLVGTTSCCSTTAGMQGDGGTTPGFNHKYINCVFNGSGGHFKLKRMYVVKTNDLEINGCTFYDYDVVFQDINVNGVELINNNCPNNDCVIDEATGTLDANDIGLANNTGFTNNLGAGSYYTISSPKAVHTCDDGLLSPGEFTVDSGGVCDLASAVGAAKTKVFTRRRN